MTEVILHVGMHKTGTSSIQETLAGFDDGQTRYARLGQGPNHSVPISLLCMPQERREQHFSSVKLGRTAEQTLRLARRFTKELQQERALGRVRLIISGEGISRLTAPDVRRLRNLLGAGDPAEDAARPVRVIAYARNPISFASSGLQQNVRGDMPLLARLAPDYRVRFDKFFHLFGADAVQILPFDRAKLAGGSVVTDFLTRCGIDPARLPEKRTNETLSAGVTRLVNAFNRSGVVSHGSAVLMQAREDLIRALQATGPGTPFSLPDDLAAQAYDDEDVRWLYRRTGIDFRRKQLPVRMGAEEKEARLAEVLAPLPRDLDRLHALATRQGVAFSGKDQPHAALWSALFAPFVRRAEARRAVQERPQARRGRQTGRG